MLKLAHNIAKAKQYFIDEYGEEGYRKLKNSLMKKLEKEDLLTKLKILDYMAGDTRLVPEVRLLAIAIMDEI